MIHAAVAEKERKWSWSSPTRWRMSNSSGMVSVAMYVEPLAVCLTINLLLCGKKN